MKHLGSKGFMDKNKLKVVLLLGTLMIFILGMADSVRAQSEPTDKADSGTSEATPAAGFNRVEELIIEAQARQAIQDIEGYLTDHPAMTVADLQADELFRKIAIQKVGDTGYTSILDSANGLVYFHPQAQLINTSVFDLGEDMRGLIELIRPAIGPICRETSGYYNWRELDGKITKKYLFSGCVARPTADGRKLLVAATTYIDKTAARAYLEKYQISNSFSAAKEAIKQKAKDVAKQIEIYLKSNPSKTVADLQTDEYFKEIAVQPVGKTGYTALTDYDTLTNRFHKNPEMVNLDIVKLSEKLPGFWRIISATKGGQESDGIYDWQEADGSIKQKYMYIAIVDARTADNAGFSVAATTYLDEYSAIPADEGTGAEPERSDQAPSMEADDTHAARTGLSLVWPLMLAVILTGGILSVFFMNRSYTVNRIIMLFLIGGVGAIIMLFIANSLYLNRNHRDMMLSTAKEYQLVLTEARAAEINTALEALSNELSFLADDLAGLEPLSPRVTSYLEASYIKKRELVYAAYRISKDGIIVNMHPRDYNALGADISAQEHMKEMAAAPKIIISGVFRAVEGFDAVTIHCPVFVDGQYDGTVAYLINLNMLSRFAMPAAVSERFETYLVDQVGVIIGAVDGSDDQEIGRIISEIGPDALTDFLSAAMVQKTMTVAGLEKIVVSVPVKAEANNWHFITFLDKNMALAEAEVFVRGNWIFTGGSIISTIIVSFIFLQLLTRSLKKQVLNKTSELSKSKKIIEEQWLREKDIRQEKEKLLAEQKQAQEKIEEKIEEMEKFQKLTVDRELKMIELKKKIKELEKF
jgi:hypothetical protein